MHAWIKIQAQNPNTRANYSFYDTCWRCSLPCMHAWKETRRVLLNKAIVKIYIALRSVCGNILNQDRELRSCRKTLKKMKDGWISRKIAYFVRACQRNTELILDCEQWPPQWLYDSRLRCSP